MRSTSLYSWKQVRRARSSLQESIGTFNPTEGETVPASGTLPLTSGEIAYLDYNATAPLRAEARQAMAAAFEIPGNSSSTHAYGQWARDVVERAREQLASLVDCSETEIIFTSGATEANNLALRALSARQGRPAVSAVEHPAVIAAADAWSGDGPALRVPVDTSGRVEAEALREVLRRQPVAYLSVMAANNETGVLNDVENLRLVAADFDVPVHTDATQLVGRGAVSFRDLGVAMLSLSAHKFGGPQGVGALIVRRDLLSQIRPLAHGGGQERGHRSGTTNVAGIAGLGAAAAAAAQRMPEEYAHVCALRDELERQLSTISDSIVLGAAAPRLPGVTNISFVDAPADAVIAAMPNVAVSHGSACAGGAPGPLSVLLAMGVPPEVADCALRYSLGHATTPRDVSLACEATKQAVQRVRHVMNAEPTPTSLGARA